MKHCFIISEVSISKILLLRHRNLEKFRKEMEKKHCNKSNKGNVIYTNMTVEDAMKRSTSMNKTMIIKEKIREVAFVLRR